MRYFYTFLLLIFSTYSVHSQSTLPIDFETGSDVFQDFSGGVGTLISNPQANGINNSSKVGQIIKGDGAMWAGSQIKLTSTLDFTTNNSIKLKVFSPRANMPIRLNLEKEGDETKTLNNTKTTTVANQWEEIIFDFSGSQSGLYNVITFIFDYGTVGDGSSDFTFLMDDISFENSSTPTQLNLPVNFESNSTDYSLLDFSGTLSYLVTDPTSSDNVVIKTIKTQSTETQTWAGTIVGTEDGFTNNIPFALNNAYMSVRVYAPVSGIPIRLKIEHYLSGVYFIEAEVINTLANEWETLVFDFGNPVGGSDGYSLDYDYNVASIFFDYGGEGNDLAYFWDDLSYGNATNVLSSQFDNELQIYPNPAHDFIQIKANNISKIEIYSLLGERVKYLNSINNENLSLSIRDLEKGIYILSVTTNGHQQLERFVKY